MAELHIEITVNFESEPLGLPTEKEIFADLHEFSVLIVRNVIQPERRVKIRFANAEVLLDNIRE